MAVINGTDGAFGLTLDVDGNLTPSRSAMSGVPFVLPVGISNPGPAAGFPIILLPSFAGSALTTSAAPSTAASYSLDIRRFNGAFQLCTVSFAAGATSGTFGSPNGNLLLPATSAWPKSQGAILLLPDDCLLIEGSAQGLNDLTYAGITLLLAARGL